MNTTDRPDHAGVKIPPPIILLVSILAGLYFDSPWFSGQMTETVFLVSGAALIAAGIALVVSTARRFKKAATHIEPWKSTSTVMKDGIYSRTRNPIYLGMVIAHAGFAIAGQSLGAALTCVLFIVIIQNYVIAREERYLESKFGNEYLDYKKKVRRWI